jgi:hypothetical protein
VLLLLLLLQVTLDGKIHPVDELETKWAKAKPHGAKLIAGSSKRDQGAASGRCEEMIPMVSNGNYISSAVRFLLDQVTMKCEYLSQRSWLPP